MSSETPASPGGDRSAHRDKKIAIYVVAQDAVRSLAGVLDRIPTPVRQRVNEIFVCDAASHDDTYLVGVGYKEVSGIENLTVVRGRGGGFGANNKDALAHCRRQGFDVVVLLHADGKYAPEAIDDLLQPLLRDDVDAVFGSRFLGESPLRGGIPLHKYLVMRAFIALQKRLIGMGLTDYHCGYRAYSVPALSELPIDLSSDQMVFDTEIVIQMKQKDLRIAEVPVPTYTGAETNGLRGVRYGVQVLRALLQFWLHTKGLREYPKFAITEKYRYKASPDASHQKILSLIDKDRRTVLDVGCGGGFLSEALAVRGNTVVGVDTRRVPGVEERVGTFLQVDLDRDPVPWSGEPFSFIVLADLLEHLREPRSLLDQCHKLLADDGALIVSVPNVAHWSVRFALLFGRFRYRARGILDRSHLRFFTLSSIRTELEDAGFRVDRVEATAAPFDELLPGRTGSGLTRLQTLGNRLWREFFAYQFVLRARKSSE
jgi:SAM-dependent methyltransferase